MPASYTILKAMANFNSKLARDFPNIIYITNRNKPIMIDLTFNLEKDLVFFDF